MAKRIYISTNEASYFIDNSMSIGHSIPIAGYHKVGDIVISNRQTDKIFGWVCIKEGEPGEWDVICDIRNIDNTVVNITKDVQDIISQLKNHKLIIDDINERIDDIQEQIDDLKEVDKDLQNQINGLKNEVEQNAADEKEVDDGLQDQIDDLKNKVNQNSSSGKEVTDGLQDQIDNLKNEVKQNVADEKEIDDGLQDQIDELKNEVKQNVADEREIDDGLQDQIDDLKEADGALNEKIDEIKKGIVDALVEKDVDVDMNTSWKDLFNNIINRIPQEIPCKGLTLNKDNVSLKVGETETIIATKTPVDSTDNIIWISGNTPIATVNMEGKITAIDAGDAIVTAICGSQVATCHVTVTVQEIPCTELSLNKNSLSFTAVNNNQTIIATPTPSNTTDVVTWKSSNDSVAIVNNGVVTSKGEGSCTITATCGSKTATCNVVVEIAEQEIPCTELSLNKSTLSFNELTGTQTLIATIVPITCNEKVTWKSSDNNVVVVVDDGTYDSLVDQAKVDISLVETLIARGIVTPKGEGSCTITATCGSKTATCNVVVEIEEEPEIPEEPEVDITVTQSSVTVDTSVGNVTLIMKEYFKVNNPDINYNDVAWSVKNTSGNIGSMYGDSLVIPHQTVATGVVTASYGNNSVSITVIAIMEKIEIECTSLSFNVSEVLVGKDRTEPYNMMEHLNYRPLTILPSYINWSVSNTSLATIDNSGLVTIKGVTGTCNIVAKCGDKTATCPFVIYDGSNIDCTSISFSQASVNITQLANYDLNQLLNIVPEDCNLPVEWYCDTNILTVENGIVTPLKNGSVKVQARCGDLSANINVIINVVEEEEPKPDSGIILFKDGTEYNDTIFRNLCLASGEVSDYIYYNLTHSRQHMWLSFDGYVDFNNYDRVDVTLYTEKSDQQPNLGIGIASKSGQCGYNSDSAWEGIHQSYKTVMTNKTKTTYSLDINYTGAGYLLLWMNNGETNIPGGVYITEIVVYPKEETPVEKPCTSIYFNNTTGFKITGSETLDLNQYLVVQPEGCTDDIIWTTDSNVVAVSDGIVTVLKGGSAKVQARCGEYAATVTVEAVKEVGDGGIVLLSDGEYFNDTEFGSLCANTVNRDLIDSNGALVYEMNTTYTTAFFSFGDMKHRYVNFNNYDAVELTIYTENNNQVPYIQVCRTEAREVPSGQYGYGETTSPSGILESTGFYVDTKKVPTVYTVNMAELRKYEADMGNLLIIVKRGGALRDTADGKVYISKIVVYPEGTYYTEPIDE